MTRILSGINPSSTKGLHIGNYFAMVQPAVALQETGECFYFVASNHALNTVFDGEQLRTSVFETYAQMYALGMNHPNTVFFVESDVPEIAVLADIIRNCVTLAEMKRMHGYKDKLAKDADPDAINMGLFTYPILMAADILAFDTQIVPVGEDQSQHVEICREIARTYNNRYGDVLTVPEVRIQKNVARVLGTDGKRKMSKSLGNDISIFEPEETIRKQIMSITTDPARVRPTDPGDPAKNMCFTYLRLYDYDESKVQTLEDQYRAGTIGDVAIKQLLYDVHIWYFKKARDTYAALKSNQAQLASYRHAGATKAREIAQRTVDRVMHAVGLDNT